MILADVAGSWLSSLGQLISVLTIFVVVLLLALLTTRWIANYQQGQMRNQNQNLKIIETLRLSTTNYIQIIKAGDVYLVIAVSKEHIEKLAELREDQVKEAVDGMMGQKMDMNENFHDILDKVKQHLPKK